MHQRLALDGPEITIGFDAEAFGGVASLNIVGDIVLTNVPFSAYKDTNPYNGKSRYRPGYWARVKASDFTTARAGSTGTFQFAGQAIPNNGGLVSKVSQTVVMHVADNEYTYTATIGSGGTFSNMQSALADWVNNATTLQKEAPRFHILSNGNYEIGFPTMSTGGTQRSPTKGLAVIDHANGVTAYISRGTYNSGANTWSNAYATYNTSFANGNEAWVARPAVNNLEFRDVGMDLKGIGPAQWFMGSNNPDGNTSFIWWNGCTIFNSIGARDTLYYNGSVPPQLAAARDGGTYTDVLLYQDDCYFIYAATADYTVRTSNCAVFQACAQEGNVNRFWTGNYVTATDIAFWYGVGGANSGVTPSIQFQYVGPATTAQVQFVAQGDSPFTGQINLIENGSTVLSMNMNINRANPGNLVNATFTAVKATADAFSAANGNHWTTTVLDDNWRTAYVGGADSGAGYTLNAKNTNAVGTPSIQAHTEAIHYQQTGGSLTTENMIWRNNTYINTHYTTGFITHVCRDAFIVNSVFIDPEAPFGYGNPNLYFGNLHMGIWNNWITAVYTFTSGAGGDDQTNAYSQIANNVISQGPLTGVFTQPTPPSVLYNINGVNNTYDATNINLGGTTATINTQVVNGPTGNFTPIGGSALATNLAPKTNNYDALGNARATNDLIGPWAQGVTAPTYPTQPSLPSQSYIS